MKTVFKILIITLILSSCTLNKKSFYGDNIFVTKKENLDENVGKFIIIKGEIINSKISTIIGIDVSIKDAYSKYGDLKGKTGIASGILIKNVVTNADKYSTNRGNGIFYRLKNTENNFNAEVVIDIDDN